MKKICFFVSNYYLNNKIFSESSDFVEEKTTNPFIELKKQFAQHGYDLSTQDINRRESSDFVIYNDLESDLVINPNSNNYLLMIESRVVKPYNWSKYQHQFFKKIFTWDRNLIDEQKYIGILIPIFIPEKKHFNNLNRNKNIAMIASNLKSKVPGEQYSMRRELLNWFESNHRKDIDLYGFGWNIHKFNYPFHYFNASRFLTMFFAKKYSFYKGVIRSKLDILTNYKFSIVIENDASLRGYITEKIFHSFFSGCIPIYKGNNFINEVIPKNTFINMDNFKHFSDLYTYINNLSISEIYSYQKSIQEYLKSNLISVFSSQTFSKIIVDEILKNEQF